MPKISVIMGACNCNKEEILKPAIESILRQNFRDFEFIICDDGSTDGTYELITKLTHHDSRVILLQNPVNAGLAFSLNQCLKIARGKYIARMDADDISLPMRFEKQIEFLEKNKEYVLVSSGADLIDGSKRWGRRILKAVPEKKDFLFTSPFIHASMMMKKEVLQRLNGYTVAKKTLRAEDYDLFMRLYIAGYKGYNMQQILYQIREDENAYNRRQYRYRLDEARVRYAGFTALGLMPMGWLYVLKPLLVGLFPQRFLAILRREKVKYDKETINDE